MTNAHVVEGSLDALVRTSEGDEYEGKVSGYSNEIDVALLFANELVGEQPFPLNKTAYHDVGEPVIALGSLLGYRNTVTFGHITETNCTFHIFPHTFNNVY